MKVIKKSKDESNPRKLTKRNQRANPVIAAAKVKIGIKPKMNKTHVIKRELLNVSSNSGFMNWSDIINQTAFNLFGLEPLSVSGIK